MEIYDSYKDSKIKWIDKIPSNWNKSRIRMVGDLYGGLTGKKGGDFNNEDNLSNKPFVPFTNIFNNTYISKDHFQYVNVGEEENQNRVLKNDLFFLMSSESYEDLGKCSILLEDIEELYLNSFCKGYRIKDERVNPLFLNYQLLGSLHKEMISIEGNGFTRINLRQDRLLDIPVFIPSLNEQTQIVSFLDKKNQKIDELIEKTEQKIKLLKEKRTSLINHCVTKGLNPNVEMKDSGVEWIGEIPNHWKKSRLDFLFRLYGRLGWKSLKSDEYVEEGYVFLSTPNIKGKVIDYENVNYITKERYDESPEIMLENGDVLLVKDGSTLGIVNIVEDLPRPSTVNSSIGVLKRRSQLILSKFMYYHLSTHYHQNIINRIKGGMGVPHLFQSDIKKFNVLLPPIIEQQQIVEYLDEQTQKIDITIEKETQRIELLKEYRQSLISEVVTGKIDVRDYNG